MLKTCLIIVKAVAKPVSVNVFKQILLDVTVFSSDCNYNGLGTIFSFLILVIQTVLYNPTPSSKKGLSFNTIVY